MRIKTKYIDSDNCSLRFTKYPTGSYCLTIVDEYGHPLMNVSKLVPAYIIESDEIFVKDYSENEGILDCLTELNILEEIITIPAGHTKLHLCKLLIDPEQYIEGE
jgi:hypothetical protein